ncbi:hypothetical protein PAMP_017455 [Pampus punctatissimus]
MERRVVDVQEGVESYNEGRLSLQVLPVQLDVSQLADIYIFGEAKEDQNPKCSIVWSAWSLWQTRLQKHQDIHTLEDRALKQWVLNSQSRL